MLCHREDRHTPPHHSIGLGEALQVHDAQLLRRYHVRAGVLHQFGGPPPDALICSTLDRCRHRTPLPSRNTGAAGQSNRLARRQVTVRAKQLTGHAAPFTTCAVLIKGSLTEPATSAASVDQYSSSPQRVSRTWHDPAAATPGSARYFHQFASAASGELF